MANLFRGERFDNSRQGNVKQDSQNISELNLIRKEMAGHISLMTASKNYFPLIKQVIIFLKVIRMNDGIKKDT